MDKPRLASLTRHFIISHFMCLSPLCFNTSAVWLLNRRREKAKGRERDREKGRGTKRERERQREKWSETKIKIERQTMKRHVINWLQAVGYPPRRRGGYQGRGNLKTSSLAQAWLKKSLRRLGMPARAMITRRSHRVVVVLAAASSDSPSSLWHRFMHKQTCQAQPRPHHTPSPPFPSTLSSSSFSAGAKCLSSRQSRRKMFRVICADFWEG